MVHERDFEDDLFEEEDEEREKDFESFIPSDPHGLKYTKCFKRMDKLYAELTSNSKTTPEFR